MASKLQALWNHPAGPKTIHFWAPTFKWGISIANLADSSKPPEKVSYPQQIAVTATGVIWSRYSTVITPKNWNLFSVNIVMAGTEIVVVFPGRWHNGSSPTDEEEDTPKAKIRRKNLAVFVSGGGSNFRSIYEATLKGSVHGDVVALVTNKHDCGGAEYARDKGIPVIVFPQREEVLSAEDLVILLRSYKVDLVLLAGYLKLIPAELIKCYPKAILNIHPSLLPAFGGKGYYGMKVHRAVIASGARYSGPTIHYVDEQYDTGSILAQRAVPVLAKDTAEELAARVLHEEHKLYVEVCAALCEERITWREDGVPLIRSKENPNDYH